MGVPQNPLVVLSCLGAAAAAVGALRRWRRGQGEGVPKGAARESLTLDQPEDAGSVRESQVWTTEQGGRLKAVKGAWDNESSRRENVLVKEVEKDNAGSEMEVSDNSFGHEGGTDNETVIVSSEEGGMSLASNSGEKGAAVTPDAQKLPPKSPKKKKIIRRRKVSRAGPTKPGGADVGATRDEGAPAKCPSGKTGTVADNAEKSGKVQEEARGGVLVDQGPDNLNSEAPGDIKTSKNVNKASAELQQAASKGDMKLEGSIDRTDKDEEAESTKARPPAEVPDKKHALSPFMGMKRGFLSSGKKTPPKAQKIEAAPVAGELKEVKGSQASGVVEGPRQKKIHAALAGEKAPLAEVAPHIVRKEAHSTPRKDRFLDTEAGKDRGESPERTPTSVLSAFPDSPESDNGGLAFTGPRRGGASGNAWKRGPIFADRPRGSLEGALLPLPARSSKVGGDREKYALRAGGQGSSAAPEQLAAAKGGSPVEGANKKQGDGEMVEEGREMSAPKFTESQLSVQTWLPASGENDEKPNSKETSTQQADSSEAAAPEQGGKKHDEAQQGVGESVEGNRGATEGSQRSLSEEGKGERGMASQVRGRQEVRRGGEQLVEEQRKSGPGSDSTAKADAGKPPQSPDFQYTIGDSSIDLSSNKASSPQALTGAAKPPPSDLRDSTISQIGRHNGEESLEGFEPAIENHCTPQLSPAQQPPLLIDSNLAKPGSADESNSATRDCPDAALGDHRVNRLGWANSEQDLDGFDSATESFATPAASAPASPRVNQPAFANPKKEVSGPPRASTCEIEEVASGPADTLLRGQTSGGHVNGTPSGEVNGVQGKGPEEERVAAAIAAVAVAACAWCGHALAGDDDEELALCCMLALQKLQNEAKAKESGAQVGAVASKSGAAAASDGVTPVSSATSRKLSERPSGVKGGGVVTQQQNGAWGAGQSSKTGADAKAAQLRKVEAAAHRAAEGTWWAAKVRAWFEGTSYSTAAR